ncbi:OLC1v1031885C1 [Oldenlandia corymbosa var. corymbosa]|uniref:OLC1v1031885C1 n=1 Tax=Oldenlandia corymbosa var. corymbosa TaxID=529605 RepID=A0AAV1CLA9_OLDCO|nr:OLC1v1031885C1 [Oldenlandia corymbosa var. corymbosa]
MATMNVQFLLKTLALYGLLTVALSRDVKWPTADPPSAEPPSGVVVLDPKDRNVIYLGKMSVDQHNLNPYEHDLIFESLMHAQYEHTPNVMVHWDLELKAQDDGVSHRYFARLESHDLHSKIRLIEWRQLN